MERGAAAAGGAGGLGVRDATPSDLPAVAAIYTHYVLNTTTTFHTQVRTPAEWTHRFATNVQDGPYTLLVAVVDAAVVGWAETSPFRPRPAYAPSAELSIYVDPGGLGAGVGTALLVQLLPRLEADAGFHRLYSLVTLPNDRSSRFHARHGFVHRGTLTQAGRKFDEFLDVAIHERAL